MKVIRSIFIKIIQFSAQITALWRIDINPVMIFAVYIPELKMICILLHQIYLYFRGDAAIFVFSYGNAEIVFRTIGTDFHEAILPAPYEKLDFMIPGL